jgi:archaellum biogenesis protein FlaJ (TadC family)
MISSLLTYLVVGFLAIVVLGLTLSAVGVAIGLLVKVLPLVLIGYVAVKVFGPKHRQQKEISEADRKWLES